MSAARETSFDGLEPLEPRCLLSSAPIATLTVESAIVDEAAGTPAVIRVNLDRAPGIETKVRLAFWGAMRNHEYSASQTLLIFGPDEVTKSVVISPIDDARGLGDRTIYVKIARGRGYLRGEALLGTLSLLDKEPKVAIAVIDSQAAETTTNQTPDIGTYRITHTSLVPMEVHFSMRGTARPDTDYVLSVAGTVLEGRSVTVPAGADGLTIDLTPIDDTAVRTNSLSAVMKLVSDYEYSLPHATADRSAKVLIAENDVSTKFKISSTGFTSGGRISTSKFLLKSPPLTWVNTPEGTQSFALIFDTPCPVYRPYVQWVVYNIPATETSLRSDDLPHGATQGPNSTGMSRYIGPIPPPGTRHFYYFRLYALNIPSLPSGLNRAELLNAMSGHVIKTTTVSAYAGDGIPAYNDISEYVDKWF